ncbi:MAG TPA: Mur ligase family protein [Steroidobacteraceae bacterium]|nr:Mur ligase family protein [Steroidobacteraceae bacterium]
MPFEDSRRLTGANLFFASTGAVLNVVRAPLDEALILAWRARVERVATELGWPPPQCIARRHAAGVLLALSAPRDQLLLATEVNEWALCAALVAHDPKSWAGLQAALVAAAVETDDSDANSAAAFAPVIEQSAALSRFAKLSSLEASAGLRALLKAAADRALPCFVDDAEFTLGAGSGSRTFPLSSLPAIDAVPWAELHDIPTAIITGSNGKTTSVRLVAACARAHGWRAGYNCTDGVYIDSEPRVTGDYSGPAGARLVMRDRRVQAAVLEAARGGILRRGLAASRADVALITNISSDHFGEYGVDDLNGLAEVKFSVAAAVAAQGSLVLNGDDALLRMKSCELSQRLGHAPTLAWFALDADLPLLIEARAHGASTCGVRAGRLWLHHAGGDHDLGPVAAMPLSIGGIAAYNIANLAGAALAAAALGIPAGTLAAVFASFGENAADNPGRMMRFEFMGAQVLIDYAHNPDGLRGFLSVATQLRGRGRLGLLLGHAGNRQDADITELARTAAAFRPDLIVVKEDEAHLRGRPPGEIPRIIRAELLRLGLDQSSLALRDNELDAARYALNWARPGDVLALPLHSPAARAAVVAILKD